MSDVSEEVEIIVGVKALEKFLNARGCRIKYGMLSKLTMPSSDKRPPIEGYIGNLPVFTPQKALAWYRSLILPQRTALFRQPSRKDDDQDATKPQRGRPRKQHVAETDIPPSASRRRRLEPGDIDTTSAPRTQAQPTTGPQPSGVATPFDNLSFPRKPQS
jgi:hypothetical protein